MKSTDGRDLLADAVDAVVVELGLRERLAAEGELDDGPAGGVVLEDEGSGTAPGACGEGSSARRRSPEPARLPRSRSAGNRS
jgi:hypothetical protein